MTCIAIRIQKQITIEATIIDVPSFHITNYTTKSKSNISIIGDIYLN